MYAVSSGLVGNVRVILLLLYGDTKYSCFSNFLIEVTNVFLNAVVNPLNAELNPICHLLALLGGATIVVVSRLRVKAQYSYFCISSNRIPFLSPHKVYSYV